jgi:vancomycin resistance protein VanW
MALLTRLKRQIPPHWQRQIRVLLRWGTDVRRGQVGRFAHRASARQAKGLGHWRPQVNVTQALKSAEYSENKRHNLALAIAAIEPVVIAPGQIFSFWQLVGAPDRRRGYLEGRAIVNGQLQPVVGGGLCQLSGMIYLLALQAGLPIGERHAHSQDIYTDATRFTPLGSDATVVYGYKDLRFVNSLTVPLRLGFRLDADRIVASLLAAEPIGTYTLEFVVEDCPGGRRVETRRRSERGTKVIQTDFYRVPLVADDLRECLKNPFVGIKTPDPPSPLEKGELELVQSPPS